MGLSPAAAVAASRILDAAARRLLEHDADATLAAARADLNPVHHGADKGAALRQRKPAPNRGRR
jgi:hypothetical protein